MSDTLTLKVGGMKCGGCELNLKNKIRELEGVLEVEASFQDQRVVVSFDNQQLSFEDIEDAIIEAGYQIL